MANFYETLLVPTNVDDEQLKQRYLQLQVPEDKWPVYPYHPMDLDYFQPAYETLSSSVKRAAYDEEFDIVPQKAAFKTCMEWTPEEWHGESAARGKTPGLYFAHIGIANLINGGQIDFINGFAIRRTHAKQLVLIRPDGVARKTKPPFRVSLPDCIIEIDDQGTVTVQQKRKKPEAPNWVYNWSSGTNEWFERPDFTSQIDQAKTKQGPASTPGPSKRIRRVGPSKRVRKDGPPKRVRKEPSSPFCPVCNAVVGGAECWNCGTKFVR